MENDVLYNRIMNVVHEEYGEGSTAVANPEGEATDALEKIQIGDDVYSISGGNGASGMVLTISQSGDDTVLNKNYTEIKTTMESGVIPIALHQAVPESTQLMIVVDYGYGEGIYFVDLAPILDIQTIATFEAVSEDGVLTLSQG